jgi:hypothetical protein
MHILQVFTRPSPTSNPLIPPAGAYWQGASFFHFLTLRISHRSKIMPFHTIYPPLPLKIISTPIFSPPMYAHNSHTRKTKSSLSPPVLPDSGKTQPPDVDSSDTPYSHEATISTFQKASSTGYRRDKRVRTKVGSLPTSVVTPAVSEADFCRSLRYTTACDAISE